MGYELVTSREYLSSVLAGSLLEVYGQVEPIEVDRRARSRSAPGAPRHPPVAGPAAAARGRAVQPTSSPTPTLLPKESIRFFYLDRGWTDALVEGATERRHRDDADRGQLGDPLPVHPRRGGRGRAAGPMPGWEPGAPVPSGNAGPVTGFLLRSRTVSGWPALHVARLRQDNSPSTRRSPTGTSTRPTTRACRGCDCFAWSGWPRRCCSS